MCGSTLAELHEQDLLALGVAKLGHRKIIMQAIHVLFESGGRASPEGEALIPAPPRLSAGVGAGQVEEKASGTV